MFILKTLETIHRQYLAIFQYQNREKYKIQIIQYTSAKICNKCFVSFLIDTIKLPKSNMFPFLNLKI